MRAGLKCSLALVFGLSVAQSEGKELLGGISDETAPPVAQPEPSSTENDRRIIYRVICSPEGEQLPECAQPPVNDTFEPERPRGIEAESAETPAGIEAADQPLPPAEQEDQPAALAEPKARKNSANHKKRTKKSVKKRAKKTTKPAAKRKRRQD